MAPHRAGGQPTVVFRDGDMPDPTAIWKIWRGGSILSTQSDDKELTEGYAADSAGRLHFAAEDWSQLNYRGLAQGRWTAWETNIGNMDFWYPVVALQPNDTAWIVAHQFNFGEHFNLLPIADGGTVDSVTTRSVWPSRTDHITGVVTTDEPRMHVFFSDERGVWGQDVSADTAATWGHYVQMCPGFSDP